MRRALAGISAGLFAMILVVLILAPEAWQSAPLGAENFKAIGEVLFGPYLLAFEIVSVLLVAALVGALYLAWKGSAS